MPNRFVLLVAVCLIGLSASCGTPRYKFPEASLVAPRCTIDGRFLKGPWENAELLDINGTGPLALGKRVASLARFRGDESALFIEVWTSGRSYTGWSEGFGAVDSELLPDALSSETAMVRLCDVCPNYDDPRTQLPRPYVEGFLDALARWRADSDGFGRTW